YRKHIEKDAALTRRFTLVWIEEPGLEDAIRIVQKVAEGHLIEHHKDVTVTPEAVEAAVKLSARYLHDEHLPGKAIKVLDQACSGMIIPGSLSGEPQENFQTTKGKVVTKDAVLEVIANRTNIPVEQLAKTDKERLRELENRLKTRIFAQNEAIAQVARVVKRSGAGLADPRRPLGVFLFAGPTGVGKTELALALTEALFDNEDAIFRLDMSEFMEKHQVARLIGAPPGYVGYENEGQLTGHLRRRPYSVVLLDEMEKAHEDVQHLFLQLFDTGRLTDSQGRLTDGRNVIFIMTTNLGAKEALGFVNVVKSYQEKLKVAIDDHFSMEFINRIDRIVYFTPLNEEALVAIFDREFSPFQIRLQTEKGVEVTVAENVKHQIAKQAVTQLQGARPLRRLIEDQIVTPIVDKLLTGEYQPGTKIKIDQELQFPDEQPQPKLDPGKLPFDLANMPLAGLGQPAPQSPKPKRPAT
ncbi:MAG: ATP-dependent Clp protease ATP-binding subunit, partial [Gammaproteobacteria bacterium]|nr:ATP-dependent Clp protease ATP-binding subunit [Gammaproteobacteria bacterium]